METIEEILKDNNFKKEIKEAVEIGQYKNWGYDEEKGEEFEYDCQKSEDNQIGKEFKSDIEK